MYGTSVEFPWSLSSKGNEWTCCSCCSQFDYLLWATFFSLKYISCQFISNVICCLQQKQRGWWETSGRSPQCEDAAGRWVWSRRTQHSMHWGEFKEIIYTYFTHSVHCACIPNRCPNLNIWLEYVSDFRSVMLLGCIYSFSYPIAIWSMKRLYCKCVDSPGVWP